MSGYPPYNPDAPYVPPMANSGFVQPGSNPYPQSGFGGPGPYSPAGGSPYPQAPGPYPGSAFGGAAPGAPQYGLSPSPYPDHQTTASQASV